MYPSLFVKIKSYFLHGSPILEKTYLVDQTSVIFRFSGDSFRAATRGEEVQCISFINNTFGSGKLVSLLLPEE